MTRFEKMRLAVVYAVASALRVPIKVREHYLMGYGYADTMPRTSGKSGAA